MFDKELEKILKEAIGHRVHIDTSEGGDDTGILVKVTSDVIVVKALVGKLYINRKATQIVRIQDLDAEE